MAYNENKKPSSQSIEYVDPGEPHMLLLLLLDTSGSMHDNGKIESLNAGVQKFIQEMQEDDVTSRRVEVCIIEFNSSVNQVYPFTPVRKITAPTLVAQGVTHMGEGIQAAIDAVRNRITFLDTEGIEIYKPWIFMITDGFPCGESDSALNDAAKRVKRESEMSHLKFFSLGMDDANDAQLKEFSDNVFRLTNYSFNGIFDWLTKSMVAISNSIVGTSLNISAPAGVSIQ